MITEVKMSTKVLKTEQYLKVPIFIGNLKRLFIVAAGKKKMINKYSEIQSGG